MNLGLFFYGDGNKKRDGVEFQLSAQLQKTDRDTCFFLSILCFVFLFLVYPFSFSH